MNSAAYFANQVVDRCDSTNDLARTLAEEGYPHGTWTSSRVQERGRGRGGNKWEDVPGNLYLSVVARIQDLSAWSWIPLVVGIGICESLSERFPEIPIRVKWPNDLWVGGRKLGGILCEAFPGKQNPFVIIGVGMNCGAVPEEAHGRATSLSLEISKSIHKAGGVSRVHADEVRPWVVKGVLESLTLLETRRFSLMRQTWWKWSLIQKGSWIQWGSPIQRAQVSDLGPSGELEVVVESGRLRTQKKLFAEEVQLLRPSF